LLKTHIALNEDSYLVGYDAVSFGEYLLRFKEFCSFDFQGIGFIKLENKDTIILRNVGKL
jgi:hypothetical protein